MSVNTKNTFDAFEAHNAERTGKTITGLSSDVIEERIRANLEPRNVHTLTLTQLLNELIYDNSAKTTRMEDSRKLNPHSGTANGGTGLSPDNNGAKFFEYTGDEVTRLTVEN